MTSGIFSSGVIDDGSAPTERGVGGAGFYKHLAPNGARVLGFIDSTNIRLLAEPGA